MDDVSRIPLKDAGVAGFAPYSTVLEHHHRSRTLSDPVLEHLELFETESKTFLFDTLESTGMHFRLVCGWDLAATRESCLVYNPEADAETVAARDVRDQAVEEGVDAAAANRARAVQQAVPGIDVDMAVRSVAADVATEAPPLPEATTDDRLTVAPHATWAPPEETGLADEASVPLTQRSIPVAPAPATAATAPVLEPADAPTPEPFRAIASAVRTPIEVGLLAIIRTAAAAAAVSVLLAIAIALAHRHITGRDALKNDTRRGVHDAVASAPGATISELARALRIQHATATYHLRILEEMGLVVKERVGNKTHHFANGAIGHRGARIRRLLPRMGRSLEVVRVIEGGGSSRATDVSARLGISIPGALWHLRRLEDLGVIERNGRSGDADTYRVRPDFVGA